MLISGILRILANSAYLLVFFDCYMTYFTKSFYFRDQLLFLITSLLCINAVYATDAPTEQRDFNQSQIDRRWQNQQDEILKRSDKGKSFSESRKEVTTVVNDADVAANATVAEMILETALKNQDWATIDKVLPLYVSNARHDPQLVRFIKGALLRSRWQHSQAIEQYQQMLDAEPELDNVRFDLAVMNFENKSYRHAQQLFEQLLGNKQDSMFGGLAKAYMNKISAQKKPQFSLGADVFYTDNYNQGNDSDYVYLWNLPFKNNNKMQGSFGQSVSISADQDINLAGNNYLGYSAYANAANYAKDNSYNERAVILDINYKYQTLRDNFTLGPVYTHRWLDGEQYTKDAGVNLNYGRWITPQWQYMLGYSLVERRYAKDSLSKLYNGKVSNYSINLSHIFSSKFMLYGGLFYERNVLKDSEASFKNTGISLGLTKITEKGLMLRLNLRYGRKNFDDINTYASKIRKDTTTNLSVQLKYLPWEVWGVTPTLIYSYDKISSNIPSLYSRASNQIKLSLNKDF